MSLLISNVEAAVQNIQKLEAELQAKKGLKLILVIDSRERDEKMHQILKKLKNHEIRQLNETDFQIITKNQSDVEKIEFAFERKRVDDLSSSIIDGRLRKQTNKMCANLDCKSAFIIEKMPRNDFTELDLIFGNETTLVNNNLAISHTAMLAAISNRIIKYGISCITTESSTHTALVILQCMQSVAKNLLDETENNTIMPELLCAASENETISDKIAVRKLPSNLHPATVTFFRQLLLIDRITPSFANSIIQKWPNQKSWAEFMQNTELSIVFNELKQIKNDKNKNLGPALACKLINYFYGTNYTTKNDKINV